MPILVDRFAVLTRRIEEFVNRKRLQRRLREVAQDFTSLALLRLRAASPDGSKWNDPPELFAKRRIFYALHDPRPSLRQHGITLEEGWRVPKFDFRGSTRDVLRGSISIFNDAPQIQWVLDGVNKRYVIERNSSTLSDKLSFYSFRENKVRAPRFVIRRDIIEPNSELVSALQQIDDEGNRLFTNELNNFIFGPLDRLSDG